MTCALASKDCAGRLEWHHVIKQQRLRREFPLGAAWNPGISRWRPVHRLEVDPPAWAPKMSLDEIKGDTRNRIFLCSHHHELVTKGRLKVTLPESVWAFAREFGHEGMLENDLRRAA